MKIKIKITEDDKANGLKKNMIKIVDRPIANKLIELKKAKLEKDEK